MKRFAILSVCFFLILVSTPISMAEGEVEVLTIEEDTTWFEDVTSGYIVISNGSTLTVIGCSLNVSWITMEPGSSLIMENVQAFDQGGFLEAENSTLEIRNSTLRLGGGQMVLGGSSVILESSSLDGSIHLYSSWMNVSDTSFTGGHVGIDSSAGSVVRADHITISNYSMGVFVHSSSLYISDSTIKDNSLGIHGVLGSIIEVLDSNILQNGEGVAVQSSRVLVRGGGITSSSPLCGPSGCGSISGLGVGVNLQRSNATLEDVDLDNNFYGVKAVESRLSLTNTIIHRSHWYGINAEDSVVNSTGGTFTNNDIAVLSSKLQMPWAAEHMNSNVNTFSGNNFSYVQEWGINLQVRDGNDGPLSGARVVVESRDNRGTAQRTSFTDGNGELNTLVAASYLFDNGTEVIYNHTISVSMEATDAVGRIRHTVNETINLQDNLVKTFVLPIKYPDLEVGKPVVRTNENGTALEIFVSIRNIGEAAALDFTVRCTVENYTAQRFLGDRVLNLTANETVELVFHWGSPSPGEYNISVEADLYRTLSDSNRENNVAFETYNVQSQKSFPVAQVLGGAVLLAGVFLLFKTIKKQKPDMDMKM